MSYEPTILVANGLQTAFTYAFDEGAFGLVVVSTKASGDATYTAKTEGVDYTLNRTTNTVTFSVAPADQTLVRIARDTPDTRAVNYQSGSTIDDATVDNDVTQAFYRIDELEYGLGNCIQLNDAGTAWDAEGLPIDNLGQPTGPNMAVTLSYLEAYYLGGVGATMAGFTFIVLDGTGGTTYTLTGLKGISVNSFAVLVGGAIQKPTVNYTVDNTPNPSADSQIVFGAAVPVGTGNIVIIVPTGTVVTALGEGAITVASGDSQIQDGAIPTDKLDPGVEGQYLRAGVGGVWGGAQIVPAHVSGFDAQVRTNRLDQMAVPTASVSANNQKITSLGAGTAAGDAVNKAQLDAVTPNAKKTGSVVWASGASSWTASIAVPNFKIGFLAFDFTGVVGGVGVAKTASFVFVGEQSYTDSLAGNLSITATRADSGSGCTITLATNIGTGSSPTLVSVDNKPYYAAQGDT